ncbi:amidohydrolase family protein [Falsirhodobacter sp. 20TX0035]|uniref:amidohydrolase family protein n=1 Tax=Falsirhodobacter sp. 20TX0035 TaxID=3022019 RepID=UPI00232B904D|nr:amidohydrolase family protein [Falsirhodobacter sp. 20TX0035]MDB6455111.1 amidohydrolase family protein [Falsirhodobacter sp. 20TX0035]
MNRRQMLAATAATTLLPAALRAQTPQRLLLKGAEVLGIGPADVLIEGDRIAAIGQPDAAGAEVIDMSGTLLMPGMVDTHWHMWNTIARGMGQTDLGGFSNSMAPLAKIWTPEAAALSVQLALAEAWTSGITTVHNWAHNTRSAEFAAAEWEAMRDGGIRGIFAYGYPQDLKPGERMDFAALRAFRERFADTGTMRLGLCTRGPDRSEDRIWQEEWRIAREMGLPITSHVASDRKGGTLGNIARMAEGGFLGRDVQIVHATQASDEDFRLMAQHGSPVSISPWTELEVGYGIPPVARMAAAGLRIGLSVDNMVLAGNADMFGVMKVTSDLASGQTETQGAVKDATVLHWATAGGAETLGIADLGMIAPGMLADLVAVRTDAVNTAPVRTPEFLLTHAAHPGNVDTVIAGGILRKRGGALVGIDHTALLAEATRLMASLRRRAGID